METTGGNEEHSLSAEEVGNNVDLLTMILLRVPAKSLVRFKCISKHWLSLISDSKFSNNHTSKNLKLSVLGLYVNCRPLINLKKKSQDGLPNLDFLDTSDGVKAEILHSCNGLMLCSRGPEIIVCNPTTHKFKVIYSSSPSRSSRDNWFIAFYPMRSPHYKVVLMGYKSSSELGYNFSMPLYQASIYSSNTGTWKNSTVITESQPLFNVLCAGSIYWTDDYNNLSRFDIDKVDNFQMPIECAVFGGSLVFWYGEYGGHLSLVRTTSPYPDWNLKFQVLGMDVVDFSWTISYNVDIKPIVDTFNLTVRRVNVLGLMGVGEEQTLILVFTISDKIISYDLKSNYFEIIRDGMDDFYWPRAHNFVASLASV